MIKYKPLPFSLHGPQRSIGCTQISVCTYSYTWGALSGAHSHTCCAHTHMLHTARNQSDLRGWSRCKRQAPFLSLCKGHSANIAFGDGWWWSSGKWVWASSDRLNGLLLVSRRVHLLIHLPWCLRLLHHFDLRRHLLALLLC